MFASLNYVHTRHPYGDFPGQPSQAPQSNGQDHSAVNGDGQQGESTSSGHEVSAGTPRPETKTDFDAALREMAQDIVMVQHKFEHIVNNLPGIGSSEADQERRMRKLVVEVRQAEELRAKKEVERLKMADQLGEFISQSKRVP